MYCLEVFCLDSKCVGDSLFFEIVPYGFNSFKFVDMCFMAQIMVYLGICLWILEKNGYSAVIVSSSLYMSIRFCSLIVLLSSSISFLIFCVLFLSVVESPDITEFSYFSFPFYHMVYIDTLQGFLVTPGQD